MRIVLILAALCHLAAADIPEIALERAFPELEVERPVDADFTDSDIGLVYVVEQHKGKIWAMDATGDGSDAVVVLDLSGRSSSKGNENGLLALELSPDFADSGLCYVYYTSERPKKKGATRQSVLSRFRFNDPKAPIDPDTQEILIQFNQPYGNHNGGDLRFGPDGMLYFAIGDGGSQRDPERRAQDLSNWFGSVVRIDVSVQGEGRPYGIPADNPFVNDPDALSEIWCYGLRNPWRIAFDRATGDLWCADVGQNKWEEVSVLVSGGNYGWLAFEGRHPTDKITDVPVPAEHIEPVFEYPHTMADGGFSISGGAVYRGVDFTDLQGVYLCADYVSGNMWGIDADSPDNYRKFALNSKGISAFAENPQGEMFAINLLSGELHRVVVP